MVMTADSIVNVAALNKWYGDFHVLRDINLDVARGERMRGRHHSEQWLRHCELHANPGFGGFAAVLARFFNAGSGDPSDDVGASLHFGRVSSDPKGQLTVLAVSFHNGNYSFIWLGNVLLGTPVTATLTWDQANHQFLFSWTNSVTHVKTNGAMPYSFSDTTPAADPTKSLELELFPANCTARQTWVYTDARFDNVYIGQ